MPFSCSLVREAHGVCFDTRRRLKGGEYPIVRVKHESILCYHRIGAVGEISPSFLIFVMDVVAKAEVVGI